MEAASEGSDNGEVLAVELQAIFATMQENVAAHAASSKVNTTPFRVASGANPLPHAPGGT